LPLSKFREQLAELLLVLPFRAAIEIVAQKPFLASAENKVQL
jgi:hypothetical protein